MRGAKQDGLEPAVQLERGDRQHGTGPKSSTCWYRIQAKTAPEVACKIPNCEALNSNDPGAMLGFRPLSGTNGEGKYNNIYPILFLSGAARPAIPILLFIGAPLLVSLLVLL